MTRASDLGRLADVLESARLIQAYVQQHTDAAGLVADTMAQDAIVRRIAIIHEAYAKLSDETKARLAGIPFAKIKGMRNIAIHAYQQTDEVIVFHVAKHEIATVIEIVSPVFDELSASNEA
jgi:uncharacterized protein with HEPN domain